MAAAPMILVNISGEMYDGGNSPVAVFPNVARAMAWCAGRNPGISKWARCGEDWLGYRWGGFENRHHKEQWVLEPISNDLAPGEDFL